MGSPPNTPPRRTAQRDTIARVITEAPGPLTVEQILDAAQADLPNLGVATVYRTVKLLLETGEIQTVVLPDGVNRYESAQLGHHHHFRCRACGKVFDLDTCPVKLPANMKLPGGFVVDAHELTLYGTCPTCQ